MSNLEPAERLKRAFTDIGLFSRTLLNRPLRRYQLAPAQAIANSVRHNLGLTFAIMMSRQAGKNETTAQLEAFLLNQRRRSGGFIIKASPTFRPQAINSMMRLQQVHHRSPLPVPRKEGAYILRAGRARIAFYGAGEYSSVVGATADILLEADEAQDIAADKWNKDFRPMAASTNATTVLCGTAWTSQTLLATTIAQLRDQERRDGIQRVFLAKWDDVAAEVPAYRAYVQSEIERLGPTHPLIRTQYLLEEIDDQAGMFTADTQAAMHGTHPPAQGPAPGRSYAMLIDVAGEQTQPRISTRKDSTVATIVSLESDATNRLRFHVQQRYGWTGIGHEHLATELLTLADRWGILYCVIDATGIGATLSNMLKAELGPRLIPFIFTSASKSALGWNFLGLCNTGRFKDHAMTDDAAQAIFWQQVRAAQYEVTNDTSELMRWSVPDPRIHDDYLISAALCAALPDTPPPSGASAIIEAPDVL